MKTNITVNDYSCSPESRGQVYTVFISDYDMERVWDLLSEQEKKSFRNLSSGTMAQTLLALTMIVYTIEQNKDLAELVNIEEK